MLFTAFRNVVRHTCVKKFGSPVPKAHSLLCSSGYTGHKPFLWPRFGEANVPLTKKSMCDFTNSFQHRRNTEWVPIAPAGSGTCQPSAQVNEIYMKNIGLLPSYKGHVPGAMFR